MAKSTHSQEALTGTPDSYTEDEMADPYAPDHVAAQVELLGGESELAGTDSLERSSSEEPSNESLTADPPELAPTMESPSNRQGRMEEDSSANSTDTDGPKVTQRRSAKRRPAKADPDEFD